MIESSNSCGCLLTHVQGAGLPPEASSSVTSYGQRLLDEIRDCNTLESSLNVRTTLNNGWTFVVETSWGESASTYKLQLFHNKRNVRRVQRRRECRPSMECGLQLCEEYEVLLLSGILPDFPRRSSRYHNGFEVAWASPR